MGLDINKIKESKTTEELLNFGVINIDKPAGPTSFSVSNFVRKSLNISKTSHMGTLDPMVTGVLPITLGRACRLSEYFMHKNKTYVGIMRLHEYISDEKLKEAMENFIGKIKQLPPVKSRVKREIREREIISFDILERNGKDVLFSSEVQAGTYIRKLISDLGEKIGGAHMLELRRIKAGMFDKSLLVNLYEFEKAVEEYKKGNDKPLRKIIFPAEIIINYLPVVQIKPEIIKQLLTGKPIFKKDILESSSIKEGENFVAFVSQKFIGVYKAVNEGDIFAKAEFVFN